MSTDPDEDFFEKTFVSDHIPVTYQHGGTFRAQPCLVVIAGAAEFIGRQYFLDKEITNIGRKLNSEICIAEVSLSNEHARITMEDGKTFITDLGSTNKTYLNDQQLEPYTDHPIKNDDQIRTGSLILKYLAQGLLAETSEKSRMQGEISVAREVQSNLLPTQVWGQYKGLHLAGRYQTASECGGDWWWHWGTKNKAFALIADATGHGVGSALITSAARAAIGVIEEDETTDIEKVYLTLTTAINKCANATLTMSAFLVEADLENRKIRYINASHLPAVAMPRTQAELRWNQLIFVGEPVSPSLGSENKEFKVGEGTVPPSGMRLILLTDGLVERRMANNEAMKERDFNNMLIKTHNENLASPRQFLETLFKKSDEKAGGVPQDDDITAVMMDFD